MTVVGSNVGNVHNLQQGEGYATVLNQNALLEDALYQKKAGLLAKQAQKKAAADDFDSLDPKFSYLHQEEKVKIMDDVQEKYISLQEKGVENPFRATDPESQALQRRAKEGLAIGVVSEEIGKSYTKFRDILSDKEKAGKIKNADEIKQWYHNVSAEKVYRENIQFPEIQFKEPAFDTLGTNYKLGKTWTDTNKKPMSYDDADAYADQILSSPEYGEPDGYIQAMKQSYNELMPEDKNKYIGKAQKKGDGSIKDQVKFFIADQVRNSSGGEVDMGALIAEDAKRTNVAVSSDEEGKMWTYVKGGEKDYVKKRTTSLLKSNIGQIERDVEKGMYGSPDNTPKENYDAAYKHYSGIYTANIERKYAAAKNDSKAGKEKEFEEGFNRWLYNVKHGDAFDRKDAALFGSGASDPQKGGIISDANVYTPEQVSKAISGKYPKLRVGGTIKEPKIKNRFLVVNTKDKSKLTALQEFNFSEDFGKSELEAFKKEIGQSDVVIYELDDKNTQALRKVYKEFSDSQGQNYKPTQQSVESLFDF